MLATNSVAFDSHSPNYSVAIYYSDEGEKPFSVSPPLCSPLWTRSTVFTWTFTKPLSKVKIIMLRNASHNLSDPSVSTALQRKILATIKEPIKKQQKTKQNAVLCENNNRSTPTCEWWACLERIIWIEMHFTDLRIVIPCLCPALFCDCYANYICVNITSFCLSLPCVVSEKNLGFVHHCPLHVDEFSRLFNRFNYSWVDTKMFV